MNFRIIEVTDPDDPLIHDVWIMCQRAHRAELACGPGATWPKQGRIRDAARVDHQRLYVALDDEDAPVGMMIARTTDGRVDWYKAEPHLIGDLLYAMGRHVRGELGACWGVIPNEAVRTAPAAYWNGHNEGEDTAILRWRD